MEKHSIPGMAKIAAATALPAIFLSGCLYYATGHEDGNEKNQLTVQLGAEPRPRGADPSAANVRQEQAQEHVPPARRAALGILKGMGPGGGP